MKLLSHFYLDQHSASSFGQLNENSDKGDNSDLDYEFLEGVKWAKDMNITPDKIPDHNQGPNSVNLDSILNDKQNVILSIKQQEYFKQSFKRQNSRNNLYTQNYTIANKIPDGADLEDLEDNELTSDMSMQSNKDASDSENQSMDFEEDVIAPQKDLKSGQKSETLHNTSLKDMVIDDENIVIQQPPKYIDALIKSQREKLANKIKKVLLTNGKLFLLYDKI